MKASHALIIAAATVFGTVVVPFLILYAPNRSQITVIVNDPGACIEQEAVNEFRYPLEVKNDNGERVRVTALVVTFCIRSDVAVEPKFLDNTIEVAQEVLYRKEEMGELVTVYDVVTQTDSVMRTYIGSYQRYAGSVLITNVRTIHVTYGVAK